MPRPDRVGSPNSAGRNSGGPASARGPVQRIIAGQPPARKRTDDDQNDRLQWRARALRHLALAGLALGTLLAPRTGRGRRSWPCAPRVPPCSAAQPVASRPSAPTDDGGDHRRGVHLPPRALPDRPDARRSRAPARRHGRAGHRPRAAGPGPTDRRAARSARRSQRGLAGVPPHLPEHRRAPAPGPAHPATSGAGHHRRPGGQPARRPYAVCRAPAGRGRQRRWSVERAGRAGRVRPRPAALRRREPARADHRARCSSSRSMPAAPRPTRGCGRATSSPRSMGSPPFVQGLVDQAVLAQLDGPATLHLRSAGP